MSNSAQLDVEKAPMVWDRSVALYVAARLNEIRRALNEEIARFDLYPEDRKELHKEVDALNRVIARFARGRIAREERTMFGEPEFLVLAEWADDAIEIYETPESELAERLADLEEDEAVTTTYRVIPEVGTPWTVFSSLEGGGEALAEERRRLVEERNAADAEVKAEPEPEPEPKPEPEPVALKARVRADRPVPPKKSTSFLGHRARRGAPAFKVER